jgi:hypothetical protein
VISHIQSECGKYLKKICGILLVPHNTIMDLNNVMNNDDNLRNLLLEHTFLIERGEEVSNGDITIDIWFQTSYYRTTKAGQKIIPQKNAE